MVEIDVDAGNGTEDAWGACLDMLELAPSIRIFDTGACYRSDTPRSHCVNDCALLEDAPLAKHSILYALVPNRIRVAVRRVPTAWHAKGRAVMT